jgi:hypothetical protein
LLSKLHFVSRPKTNVISPKRPLLPLTCSFVALSAQGKGKGMGSKGMGKGKGKGKVKKRFKRRENHADHMSRLD